MTSRFGRFLRHNTIALIALFFALAGTTFAAANALPRNSVGTKQLKNNAVISSKIKNNQVTGADVKESSLGKVPSAANADHATAADNATNATHATSADTATTASKANAPGTLGSGQTETGAVYVITPQNGASNYLGASISYPIPLAAPASASYLPFGTTTTACPGSAANPSAASGHLCVYEVSTSATGVGFEDVGKYGAGIYGQTAAGSSYDYITAVWAVTG
jgi:hypothetical protein